MTREDAIRKAINIVTYFEAHFAKSKEARENAAEIIEILEQEPCEDEYIKVPKKALKYRTAGMVAYNVEWLKNHFNIEQAVICGQQPCEDAISRQAVLEKAINVPIAKVVTEDKVIYRKIVFVDDIENLPSVTPQPKTGRWIEVIDETDSLGNKTWHHECSICGSDKSGWGTYKHCPDCGTKMEVEE